MIVIRPALVGRDVVIGLGCWSITVALVTGLVLTVPGPELRGIEIAGLPWWSLMGALTVQAAGLFWYRTYPGSVVALVSATPVVLVVFSSSALFSVTAIPVMVVVLLVVARFSLGDMKWALALGALATFVADSVHRVSFGGVGVVAALTQSAMQTVVVVGAPFLIGSVFASRRAARLAHAKELSALERERVALVRAAVADERASMARELHDIAAHHLSGIALMASATARQVDTEPDAARKSAGMIRDQARAVLDDLRRLVGLLRDGASTADHHVETIEAITDLVHERRSAGTTIELVTVGATDAAALAAHVGPLAQLVAYRMVQQALANASTHAPGAGCVVRLDGRSAGSVQVTVTNDKPRSVVVTESSEGGFGLVGMVERAALVGARLTYGPTDGGGWCVSLELPREAPMSEREESA
ncbi:sensor histidine kinase [Rhodococcus fascians]|nr:sensor histidine kinase [Rhodococcus fascians]MBY4238053.1 sensor histidine kinase [Rhodococcus fascians]MBY4254028.1 sensor histidine kinase [Rhodococcus fascians]MBY4269588.1 sensor histidine kinase [Rhodococcus fascians]